MDPQTEPLRLYPYTGLDEISRRLRSNAASLLVTFRTYDAECLLRDPSHRQLMEKIAEDCGLKRSTAYLAVKGASTPKVRNLVRSWLRKESCRLGEELLSHQAHILVALAAWKAENEYTDAEVSEQLDRGKGAVADFKAAVKGRAERGPWADFEGRLREMIGYERL